MKRIIIKTVEKIEEKIPYAYEHKIYELIENYSSPLSKIKLQDVSCENKKDLLLEIYKKDQDIRHVGEGDIETIDH